MLFSAEADVVVDHHLFGLCDGASGESRPFPRHFGHAWLGVGTSMVYFEAAGDIYKVRVRFESWDAPAPPLDEATWPVNEVVELSLPSGVLSVDQLTAGSLPDVFTVGTLGRYGARLAWRDGEEDLDCVKPEAFALAQFWPAVAG